MLDKGAPNIFAIADFRLRIVRIEIGGGLGKCSWAGIICGI